MKKKDLIFIVVFILITGISLFYLYQSTYAKYRKQVDTNLNAKVASWNIKVNGEMIGASKTLTNSIVPTLDSNEYVKEGTIAPGTTGYFDITIDSTNVDVDFTYDITTTLNQDTNLTDFKITNYEINDSGTKNTYTDNELTGDLVKNTKNTKIRFYIAWVDDSTNSMDNKEDTEYAVDNETVEIDLAIKFSQKN